MIINIKVKTRSKESSLEKISEKVWVARLKSEAKENKANLELISLIAKKFSVAKSNVRILKGLTSKEKIIDIKI